MYSYMKYDGGYGENKNWIVSETEFDGRYLGKCESIMCLGNGYMGLRSSHEEHYVNENRGLFINGTFNRAFQNEVTELPKAADITCMEFEINGERLTLEMGKTRDYMRELNLKTGEVKRSFIWTSPKGDEISFTFYRFVSLLDMHLIGQRVEIQPLNRDSSLIIISGIDGRGTNSGSQHFIEGEKRLYHNKYIQMVETTGESKVDFVLTSVHSFLKDGELIEPDKSFIRIERRRIYFEYHISAYKNQKIIIEKISNVYTSRDIDLQGYTLNEIKKTSLNSLIMQSKRGYMELLKESKNTWMERVWDKFDIKIDSQNEFDQLAIRFAIYHLVIMTPSHDNRMGVGATGLSGENYKGHSFWDTELFILPYFIYNNPKAARSLLEYRYKTLDGARRKAKENGYEGAQFPWESAWLDDGEVTPKYWGVNLITGEEERVWTGVRAVHISADIVYAVWQYYNSTGDQDFMDRYGYEMVFETAAFFQSRLEWNEGKGNYQITHVMGPDEYKEDSDNNAFTNYMVHFNIKLAIKYYEELKTRNQDLFNELDKKLNLGRCYRLWTDKVNKIYLPKPDKDLILPQDDIFLSFKDIDLTKYKNQENVNSIRNDYSLEELYKIQVIKQTDVLILFYLFENLFDFETKIRNFRYYEKRCIHDSSLSLSFHSILARDIGDGELSCSLFERAERIDLGENMKSSSGGIHAASIGGIWQCVVNGFGGVRASDGNLKINPKLPEKWRSLKFPFMWKGHLLYIEITKESLIIENTKGNDEICFSFRDREYRFCYKIEIPLD